MIEHLRGRERKLEPLGWTGQEAEWIALVCLHSGVFTRAQFCHYFGDAHRWKAAHSVSCGHCLIATGGGRNRFNCFQRGREDLPDIEQRDLPGAGS